MRHDSPICVHLPCSVIASSFCYSGTNAAGMGPAAKAALGQQQRNLDRGEEFPCTLTAQLNNAVAQEFLPHARSEQTWARTGSWLNKFHSFAQVVCRSSGRRRTNEQCLRSNIMCRHFITTVAQEATGVTRARSARMVLSAARIKVGLPSLSEDPNISAVVDGAEAKEPGTKKQSAGLTDTMVKFITKNWGKGKAWFKRQIALMLALGFVSLMRLGEMCKIRLDEVRLVFHDGKEYLLSELRRWPNPKELAGVLLHLPWRKNHRHLDCWIPLACKTTVTLLLEHVQGLQRRHSVNPFLFPSKRGKKVNPTNPVGQASVVRAMRHALTECVPLMTRRWAALYTGHALRVGGSNHMRRLGIADDVHRRLGGWMTLVAAQGYMALSAQEQFKHTLKLAQSKSRKAAFHKEGALGALRRGNLLHMLR